MISSIQLSLSFLFLHKNSLKFPKTSSDHRSPPLIKPSNLLHRKLHPHPSKRVKPTSGKYKFQAFPCPFAEPLRPTSVKRCTTWCRAKETREHKRKLGPTLHVGWRKRWKELFQRLDPPSQNFPNDILRETPSIRACLAPKKRRRGGGRGRKWPSFSTPGIVNNAGKLIRETSAASVIKTICLWASQSWDKERVGWKNSTWNLRRALLSRDLLYRETEAWDLYLVFLV